MTARKPLLALCALFLAALAVYATLPPAPADILLTNISAAPIKGKPETLAVFLKIENAGGGDRLLGARSGAASRVSISARLSETGLAIPAGASPSLAADGAHLLLEGIGGPLGDGRLIPITLMFEKAGEISGKARLSAPKQEGMAHQFGLSGMGDVHRVKEGEPAPAISLGIARAGEGWQIKVQATEFTFSKDLADGPHVPGTGHGHLYLDGLKLQRLYSDSATIGALPPGTYEIRVTLNTNNHRAYVVGNTPVTASASIDVP